MTEWLIHFLLLTLQEDMKGITIILSLILLGLSITPCSDGYNAEDQSQGDLSANHSHKNDSDDSCPVTCVCNCCGMTITYQPIEIFRLKPRIIIATTTISIYKSNYRFDFHSTIWQPPQLIS